MMDTEFLNIKNICLEFPEFRLEDIDFQVRKGEYLVLLGKSGAGKSLILECISGLRRIDSGSISLEGEEISQKKIQDRKIGFVFQQPALFPHLTVFENIRYGLFSSGVSKESGRDQVRRIARRFQIDHLLERYPNDLSGGEAQRVALARSLVLNPPVLLLDEPFSSLDAQLQKEFLDLLAGMNADGQTIIHVTHNFEEAIRLASRIGVMESGKLIQLGTPGQVFLSPSSSFVSDFTGGRNFFPACLSHATDGREAISEFGPGLSMRHSSFEKEGNGYIFFRSRSIILSEKPLDVLSLNVFLARLIALENHPEGVLAKLDIGVLCSGLIQEQQALALKPYLGDKIFLGISPGSVWFVPTHHSQPFVNTESLSIL